MKAYVVGADGAVVSDIEKPQPAGANVLVQVRAACLNRADLNRAAGLYKGSNKAGPGMTLGGEGAGDIVAVGPDVKGFRVGDRVMGALQGAFAEYALADASRLFKIPANNMSYEQAASLPTGLSTMHNAVVTAGDLKPGQTVLVQGASSGVGLMAMQIAKYKGAKLVIGSSTSEARRARLSECGADIAIDSKSPGWVQQVLDATGGDGVDLIIDQVSTGMNDNMRATKIEGTIVNVGRLGGDRSEFDHDLHALRRIRYIGVTFRTRTPAETREVSRLMHEDLWDGVVAGKLALPIDKTFPLAKVAEAFDHMRTNQHFGKIVVRP